MTRHVIARSVALYLLVQASGCSVSAEGDLTTDTSEDEVSVSANRYAFRDVDAYTVHVERVVLAQGASVTIEARATSPGCNPVLHLWDPAARREVGYNDNANGTLNSRVTIPANAPRTLLAVVRSTSNGTRGTADLYRDGAVLRRAISVSGYHLAPPTGDRLTYATRLRPGGADHTVLLGLANGRLVAMQSDGLLPKQAAIPSAGVTTVVVGAMFGARAGRTDLLVNDVAISDGDGDGLGANLEAALGTCDPVNRGTWPAYCATAHNPKDSDRDGLDDAAEVFGIPGVNPQYLSKWGASPLHKDVFVEINHVHADGSQGPSPVTAEDARGFRAYYAEGPAASLRNPDGRPGVAVHLDMGIDPDPASPDYATDVSLFGNWSRGDRDLVPVPPAGGEACDAHADCPSGRCVLDTGLCEAGSWSAQSDRARDNAFGDGRTYMAPERKGVFHHALLVLGGCAGQGGIHGDSFYFCGSVVNRNFDTLAHELGHNLGLDHTGRTVLGEKNYKPNYQSMMNYRFDDAKFSMGNLAPLNPTSLDERVGIGPNATEAQKARLRTQGFDVGADGSVDWNRDGVINAQRVRANVFHTDSVATGHALIRPEVVSESAIPGSVAVVKTENGRIVVFYKRMDGRGVPSIYYRSHRYGGLASDNTPFNQPYALAWSAEARLPTSYPVEGFSATVVDDYIHLAYVDTAGQRLRHVHGSLSDAGLWRVGSPEASIPTPAGQGLRRTAPEIAYIGRTGAAALWIGYVTSADELWAVRGGIGWAPAAPMTTVGGTTLRSFVSPSLVWWKNDQTPGENETLCGAFTDTNEQDASGSHYVYLSFRCINPETLRWSERSVVHEGIEIHTKPSLVYSAYRQDNGSPLPTSTGAFMMAYNYRGKAWQRTSTPVDPRTANFDTDPASLPQFPTRVGPETSRDTQRPLAPVVVFADTTTVNIKGAWFDGPSKLIFLPHADGIFNQTQRDYDDFKLMERGICLSIRNKNEAYCGTAATSPWGY